MKNSMKNTQSQTTLNLTVIDGKKVIRLVTPDNQTFVLAFKTKTGLTAYLNNQYNAGWSTIETTYDKPDLKEHPDQYDKMLRVKSTDKLTALDVLKSLIRDAVKAESKPFGIDNVAYLKPKAKPETTPAPKTESKPKPEAKAPKAPAKKPEVPATEDLKIEVS